MSVCEMLLEWAGREENLLGSKKEVAVGREQWSSEQKILELRDLGSAPHPPELYYHLKVVALM